MKIKDKVILVTGGSRGLGAVLVETFLERKARVVSIARNHAPDDLHRKDFLCLSADLTRTEEAEKSIRLIEDAFGGIDACVSNAGFGKKIALDGSTQRDWLDVFNGNFLVTLNSCRAALRSMLRRGSGGHLINIASLAGVAACPGHSAYGTAKAAVIALTRSIAVDHASEGIRANAIAPGPMDTEGFRRSGGDPHKRSEFIPTHSMIDPLEVAQMCAFLIEQPNSITGQTFLIDGGSEAIGCYAPLCARS